EEADRAAAAIQSGTPARVALPAGRALQRQPNSSPDPDAERAKIVEVANRSTGNQTRRAWELVWRMLTRYFPEYSSQVSAVGYEEGEQGVRVEMEEAEHQGKKVQSAVVTVGRR